MFINKKKSVPTPPYFFLKRSRQENFRSFSSSTKLCFAPNEGFTLAEVLITLVIIGVIAAITVPTLITKYQKEQTITRLKKAYSALAQTTNRAIADYGPIETWELGSNNPDDAKIFIEKYITPYMNILKAPTTYNEGLWNNQLFYLNGSQHNYDNSYVRFYLNDGTSITSRISTSNSTHKYIALQIDINGDKKPNKLGKDIFRYYYIVLHDVQSIQGKFIPDGFITDRNTLLSNSNDAKCNKNQSGNQCAAVIMMDGWQIKDDYPW